MDPFRIWVLFLSLFLALHATNSQEQEEVKRALVSFLTQLSPNNGLDPSWGWNMRSDPCIDGWKGVVCVRSTLKKVVLEDLNLTGTLDLGSLCKVLSLQILSLKNNNISGEVAQEIGNCKQLTQLFLSNNQFSGILPEPLSSLNNLKRIDIANNDFSGNLPDLSRISGLVSFLAENNHITGALPKFDYSNLEQFNVSFNDLIGPAPDLKGRFDISSLLGNPGLCGGSMPNACPPPPPRKKKSKGHSVEQIFMFSGYMVIGLLVVMFIGFKLFNKKKAKDEMADAVKPHNVVTDDSSSYKRSTPSSEYKTGASKADHSMTSAESAMMSSTMVVLSSPVVKGLRFEDLLKAPAELLGRGKHSTLYKVILEDGVALAVKRIKDWAISGNDFKKRMQKLDQVKHQTVLPAVAFYCSKQEKLVVYKYQPNGSLFKLLCGTRNGQTFDWSSRLSLAASVAEGLAFMHKELLTDGIPHGNVKSSNILFNHNMDPCINEYGLMPADNQGNPPLANANIYKTTNGDRAYRPFKVDLQGFGVILLELLTGKLVENNGLELARWVHSVLKEEWTVEVFDKNLLKEGASEHGMVNLLQVALKCVDPSPDARPNMSEVAGMINAIREEDESLASMVSEG